MTKYISFIIAILFLTGCSSKKALQNLHKDSFYANALPYTQKCDILNRDNQVEVMFTATYLNYVKQKLNNQNENFIVGIYVSNNDKKRVSTKLDEEFKLLLNGKEYKNISIVRKDEKINDNLPLYNPWADYFNVEYSPIEKIKRTISANTNTEAKTTSEIPVNLDLTLQLSHSSLGSCSLKFAKEE